MPSFKVVSIRFNEDEYREVEQAASGNHLKVSTWIKQVLKKEIASKKGEGEKQQSVPVKSA